MHPRVFLASLIAISCGPTGMPTLALDGPTATFRDGTPIALRVIAADGAGRVGVGTVTIDPDVGTVDPQMLTLDAFGTGRFTYSCDLATTPDCAISKATLTVRWNLKPVVTVEQSISLRDRPVPSDGGMGGGSAGSCSRNYSRATCAGPIEPGPNVACCKQGTLIPGCTDVFICDGQRTPVTYFRGQISSPDAGLSLDAGPAVTVDLVWTVPTGRTYDNTECLSWQVGYEYEVAGRRGVARNSKHTYGVVQPTGEYTGIREAELPSLHTLFAEECTQAGTLPDAGPAAIWNSYELSNFVVTENGSFFRYTVPPNPPRFFFISLRR
jgi:hypothetical protein